MRALKQSKSGFTNVLSCAWLILHHPLAFGLTSEDPEIHDVYSPGPSLPSEEVTTSKTLSLAERNIAITKNYSILAEKLRATIDCPRQSLHSEIPFTTNWLHLATWASRLAGEFIGDQDHRFMEWAVTNWLGTKTESTLNKVLGFIAQRRNDGVVIGGNKQSAIIASVKKLLSDGNVIVANEVQSRTEQFVAYFSPKCLAIGENRVNVTELEDAFFSTHFTQYDRSSPFFQRIDQGLTQVEQNLSRFDLGDRYNLADDKILAEAFRLYFYVMITPEISDKERSQLVYLANVLVGIHEQHVLQTFIRGSLSAFDVINPNIKTAFGATVMKLGVPFQSVGCKQSVTNRLEYLKFNRDVPLEPSPSLRILDSPEVRYVFETLNLDQTIGDRAPDWTRFNSRISYIAAVYRGLHDNIYLTESPYVGWCGESE